MEKTAQRCASQFMKLVKYSLNDENEKVEMGGESVKRALSK